MTNKGRLLSQIQAAGVIAVIRANDSAGLVQAAQALTTGGIQVLEFTLNTPDSLKLISEARQLFGEEILVGAGTVRNEVDVRKAAEVGAQFIIMPGLEEATVKTAQELDLVVIPGAFTPTEALTAWQWGADMVKIFPASLGGPAYLRALLAPLSDLKLVPTGGVSAANAREYIQAGAAALVVGGNMVSVEAIRKREFQHLEEAARQLVTIVAEARKELAV